MLHVLVKSRMFVTNFELGWWSFEGFLSTIRSGGRGVSGCPRPSDEA